jgi:hypothetical protein
MLFRKKMPINECDHRWTVVGIAPYKRGHLVLKADGSGTGLSNEQRLSVYGYTDVSLRCLTCGDVHVKKVEGRYVEDRSVDEEDGPVTCAECDQPALEDDYLCKEHRANVA